MNDQERQLIRFLCFGNYRQAEQQARIVLAGAKTQRDQQFRDAMIAQLDKRHSLAELPSSGQGKKLLVAEDVSAFPMDRFLLRPAEEKIAQDVLDLYAVASDLMELGIPYLPAVMLHGQSGCGKTMLAKYIAYKAQLPYVYVRFSNIIDSYLGSTQQNIAKVIDFVKGTPCVLCFDEIDAVGMARGQKNDVGEMNRIVITLMQELDSLPNNVIIVGTTNRFDRLDPALVRRFPIQREVLPLAPADAESMARAFFAHAKMNDSDWIDEHIKGCFVEPTPASTVVKVCTDAIVKKLLRMKEIET